MNRISEAIPERFRRLFGGWNEDGHGSRVCFTVRVGGLKVGRSG